MLARQVFEQLQPRDGGVYIDGTFGAGGHTRAMLRGARRAASSASTATSSAIAGGAELVAWAQGRLTLVEDRFSNLEQVARSLGHEAVDGILLDLGVSSMQLDQAERGFSFRNDGPLDMRMGGDGPSAADLVNAAAERDLAIHHRDARRRALRPQRRPRDRQGPRRSPDRHDARARRDRRAGRA